MSYDGINILTGIVPGTDNVNYRYNDYDCISTVFAIDHNAVIKGVPLGSKGSLTRDYTPIRIPEVGSLYKKERIPGLSYSSIDLTTTIKPGIIAEIGSDMCVYLNHVLIAVSPGTTTTKTGKLTSRTQAGVADYRSILFNQPSIAGYTGLAAQIIAKANQGDNTAIFIKDWYEGRVATFQALYEQEKAAVVEWSKN